jgi:cyclopropane-fatty-acyl-phospholipid synthase
MIVKAQPAKNEECVAAGLSLFQTLVEDFQPMDFDIRFWDGSTWHAEQVGFEIRHVESLREHYVLTLRAWRRNLERADTEARKLVSDETVRIWRLYLAASAYSFAKGNHSVFQSLLTKPVQTPA